MLHHCHPRLSTLALALLLSACGTTPTQKQPDTSATRHTHTSDTHIDFDENCFASEEELRDNSYLLQLDLWDRLRDGYQLLPQRHPRIDAELSWYARHPDYLRRVSERAERYLHHIVEKVETRGMPMEIALLPIVESAFDPFAYSHGRASGMWQIVPGTGRVLGLKQNWWYDGRRDIVASTNAALNYLEQLHRQFNGDWLLALAAYNSGAGNVSKAIRKNQQKGKPTDFWHLDLPRETKAYVPRLIALSHLVADPVAHNITLASIPNAPYFAAVDVGAQIDLAQAADLAGIEMETLYHLNPAFNRWATDPAGPHTLLVPVASAAPFAERLASIPAEQRVTWERYTIRQGDTLSTIARKYHVSIDSLKSINKIRGNQIRAGHTLMVPVASASDEHYSHSVDTRVARRYEKVDETQQGQAIDYVVKQGDSMWSISRAHGVHHRSLAKWNSMAPTDPIRPGQTLKIWPKQAVQTAQQSVVAKAPSSTNGVIRKVNYKVRNGDSLARIAQKFRVNVTDIVKWNQLNKNKYLQPGQALTLYVDVTRTQGG